MNRFVREFFAFVCLTCLAIDAWAFIGDLSKAIFVDRVSGSDGYPGTMVQPKATFYGARSIATSGKNIYVSEGTYSEAVQLILGVSHYGQYDKASNWTPDRANTTIINGGTNPVAFASVSGETHFAPSRSRPQMQQSRKAALRLASIPARARF